jgi:hypothetical protein
MARMPTCTASRLCFVHRTRSQSNIAAAEVTAASTGCVGRERHHSVLVTLPTKHAMPKLQFTLRTFLVVLVLIACGLGFWLQEQRLSKARSILAAHGLSLEWADLKPDEVRATVVNFVESESYVFLTVRVESRQAGSVAALEKGKMRVQSGLSQVQDSEAWTGEIRVLVDKVKRLGEDPIVKVAVSAHSRGTTGRTESIQTRMDDPDLPDHVHAYLTESTVFRTGERIPLLDVGDEQFELTVR